MLNSIGVLGFCVLFFGLLVLSMILLITRVPGEFVIKPKVACWLWVCCCVVCEFCFCILGRVAVFLKCFVCGFVLLARVGSGWFWAVGWTGEWVEGWVGGRGIG